MKTCKLKNVALSSNPFTLGGYAWSELYENSFIPSLYITRNICLRVVVHHGLNTPSFFISSITQYHVTCVIFKIVRPCVNSGCKRVKYYLSVHVVPYFPVCTYLMKCHEEHSMIQVMQCSKPKTKDWAPSMRHSLLNPR